MELHVAIMAHCFHPQTTLKVSPFIMLCDQNQMQCPFHYIILIKNVVYIFTNKTGFQINDMEYNRNMIIR